MHVDVEIHGEFTRGETVANRQGYVERSVLHGDHYLVKCIDQAKLNAKVALMWAQVVSCKCSFREIRASDNTFASASVHHIFAAC